MGKETDLWDDSSLINAFDNAMIKYKMMHSKGYHGSSNEGEKVVSSSTENVPALIEGSHGDLRHDVAVENSIHALKNTESTGGTNELPPIQENYHVPEPYPCDSHGTCMEEALDGYSSSQGVVEYSQLLNQYYELEEQRQKVLQKLQQVGYWNNQSKEEVSGFQEHQVPIHQSSHPEVLSSCCPYVCHCLMAPCSPIPVCALGTVCVGGTGTDATASTCIMGPRKLSSLEDDSVVETAMGAAERAISSMKMKASCTSISCEEQNKGKGNTEDSGLSESDAAQRITPETDLTIVLNAWYSAGFYTGKYLMEQSISKGRHG